MKQNSLTHNKLQQKVFQRFWVLLMVKNKIQKVKEDLRPGKWVFQDGVQDGRYNHEMTITPLLFMLES